MTDQQTGQRDEQRPPAAAERVRGRPFARGGDERQRQRVLARAFGPDAGCGGNRLSTAELMLKVFHQPRSMDRGPAEKLLRRLIERDLDKFLGRLTAAERAEAGRTVGADTGAPSAEPMVDEGEARARQLIAEVLSAVRGPVDPAGPMASPATPS